MELDFQHIGALIIPPRPRFQITKHLNLEILVLECYLLGSLKYKRTYTFDNYKTQLGIVKKYLENVKVVVILF